MSLNPPADTESEDWLANKKAELSAINGLDPVEELLTQIGVIQASNQAAVRRMNEAFEALAQLQQKHEQLECANASLRSMLEVCQADNRQLLSERNQALAMLYKAARPPQEMSNRLAAPSNSHHTALGDQQS